MRKTALLSSATAKLAKWLLIASGKGGTGKTSTAFNLAVIAAHGGLRVCLVDLDSQPSLTEWHAVRTSQEPEAPEISLWAGQVPDIRRAIAEVDSGNFDLVIVDTPPALDNEDITTLLQRSTFVLVPTTQGVMDMKASVTWMAFLKSKSVSAGFMLNRAQRTFGSYQRAKLRLVKFGALCPIDIRLLDDVAASGDLGLGVFEMAKSRATEDYRGVFDYVCHQLGLLA